MDSFIGDFDPEGQVRAVLLGTIFKLFIIPTYVMVVSNLVNMHSGYNGLQSGLSLIILSTLVTNPGLAIISDIYPSFAFCVRFFAFWIYNKYPSRVFEGNIGSLLFGFIIGCVIVIQEYWWFGFFYSNPTYF